MDATMLPVAALVTSQAERFIPVVRHQRLTVAGVTASFVTTRGVGLPLAPVPIADPITQRVVSALYLAYEDPWLRGVVMVRANGTPGGPIECVEYDVGGIEMCFRRVYPCAAGPYGARRMQDG